VIDTHAHLDFPQFDADRGAVLTRARAAGLRAILTVGTDVPSSQRAVALAAEHPDVYAAVGCHPHEARTLTAEGLAELRRLATQPRVVAIGEIGLDYYRDHSPRAVQREVLGHLLGLAAEARLPVIVHTREAHEDVLAVLRGYRGVGGVVHAYSGGLARLEEVLTLGFHIGIAGPVTFPNAHELRQVAARAPLERLLLETDCPYLTPAPFRGQRNEPAYVRYVAEAMAQARGAAVDETCRATAENAVRLFGLEVRDL